MKGAEGVCSMCTLKDKTLRLSPAQEMQMQLNRDLLSGTTSVYTPTFPSPCPLLLKAAQTFPRAVAHPSPRPCG